MKQFLLPSPVVPGTLEGTSDTPTDLTKEISRLCPLVSGRCISERDELKQGLFGV